MFCANTHLALAPAFSSGTDHTGPDGKRAIVLPTNGDNRLRCLEATATKMLGSQRIEL
jgi:hypothetical protein